MVSSAVIYKAVLGGSFAIALANANVKQAHRNWWFRVCVRFVFAVLQCLQPDVQSPQISAAQILSAVELQNSAHINHFFCKKMTTHYTSDIYKLVSWTPRIFLTLPISHLSTLIFAYTSHFAYNNVSFHLHCTNVQVGLFLVTIQSMEFLQGYWTTYKQMKNRENDAEIWTPQSIWRTICWVLVSLYVTPYLILIHV